MNIEGITFKQANQFIVDYKKHKAELMKYFSYKPFSLETDHERLKDLQKRVFNREDLVHALKEKNKVWNGSHVTMENIERLRDEKSVVVIGGQQAGLLTGPLYTINKVISIIKIAKEKEEKLGVPVIPVFWIAGEDHDYDEINHTYILKNDPQKIMINYMTGNKQSISSIPKNDEDLDAFIRTVFSSLEETPLTKDLYTSIQQVADQSTTYVDFFAMMIHSLFKEYGVVLIDSGDEMVRKLESEHFISLIQKQKELSKVVYHSKLSLEQAGYPIAVDVEQDNAHLFYTHHGERLLLNVTNDCWADRDGLVSFSTKEMIDIAKNHPERLSNNVVTRPIMQELLFPTLAFVGGNAEIAYWSILKRAFELFDLSVPPVLPRYSVTYIDSKIEKLLARLNTSMEEVLNHELDTKKMNWLSSQTSPPLEVLFREFQRMLETNHKTIQEVASKIRVDTGRLAEKNLEKLSVELAFLKEKMNQALEEEYRKTLNDYTYINHVVLPFDGLQERVWSPIPLLNKHGDCFIRSFIEAELDVSTDHYIVTV